MQQLEFAFQIHSHLFTLIGEFSSIKLLDRKNKFVFYNIHPWFNHGQDILKKKNHGQDMSFLLSLVSSSWHVLKKYKSFKYINGGWSDNINL